MSLSVTLDVAIGLIGLYLALSVIASILLEFYAALLARPAKLLRWGIGELFMDPLHSGLAQAFYTHPLIRGMTGGKLPSQVDPKVAAQVLVDLMDQSGVLKGATPTPVLAPFVRAFGTEKDKLLQPIAEWFDAGVKRLSGVAARRSHVLLLGIGVVMAVVFNIDSIEVARALSSQEALRKVAVAQAEYQLELCREQKTEDCIEVSADSDAAKQQIDKKVAALVTNYSALPIGWPDSLCRTLRAERSLSGEILPAKDCQPKQPPTGAAGSAIGAHWLGWVITALAISLGAQFWYRLLGRLIKLRGGAPAKTDKKSKV